MSDRLPISPISPAQRLETQKVTDLGRAQLAQMDAEGRRLDAQAQAIHSTFQGLGNLCLLYTSDAADE